MEKKKAIAKIAFISLLSILLVVFAIISFMPAGSVKGFAGFAGAITKGLDFEGGVYANYTSAPIGEMTDEEFKDALNETYKKVSSIIEQKGYTDAKVFLTSDNKIRIESPNVDDAEEILNLIGDGELKISTSSSNSGDAILTGKNITAAFAMQNPSTGTWGTYVGFNEEGMKAVKTATKGASSSSKTTLYFFRGNDTSAFTSLSFDSPYTSDFFFISYTNGSMTQEQAVSLAVQISTGSFKTILTVDGTTDWISSSTGDEALLGLTIASAAAALVILIIFAIVYRELGLMAIISILMFIGGMLFFMQAIPVITLSVASLGAGLVCLVLISACHFILLEKIRAEYAVGKKLKTAVKTGYKKSVSVISEICGAIAIISTVAYFILTGAVKSFAMIMIAGSLLALLITLFFTYHLAKSYAALNSENGKRVNFSREENIDEIE